MLLISESSAQALRDPTVAPGAPSTAAATKRQAGLALESGNMAVLVRAGTPYLVIGTRLYSTGQTIGQAHIEHITETEVWLREAGRVRKVSVFSGIERRVASRADANLVNKNTRPTAVRSHLSTP